jgi:hypothetical protein
MPCARRGCPNNCKLAEREGQVSMTRAACPFRVNRVVLSARSQFRSTSTNGHLQSRSACLKSANRRHRFTDGGSISGDRKLNESTPRLARGRPQRPPWASMIERQIDRPMPMPLDLVMKKAENSWSAFSEDIPTPQSVTLTSTGCFSCWRDRIRSSRGRSVTDCIDSMPFITRLMITCCS